MGGALNPAFYKTIPAAGVTVFFGIGDVFERWMKLPESVGFDFSSLGFVAIGGSNISAGDKRRYYEFLQQHGCGEVPLLNGYGISELGGACCLSSPDLDDESIGHLLPGLDLRLWDEEQEKFFSLKDSPCQGVLYLYSPSMASPELDGKPLYETVTVNRRQYICTNDAVRVDEEGKLSYLGRSNRYFIHGGEKYEAGLVETEFARQEGIESCCVAPVYDKITHDNIPMLCLKPLEPGDGAVDVVHRALLQVFKIDKTLPPAQIPAQVLITGELPRNANGKIDLYKISRGEVSGARYAVETVRLLDQIADFKLTFLEQGGSDLIRNIKKIIKMMAGDGKEDLPFPHTKAKNEEADTVKNKIDPFACIHAMNEMGSQLMSSMLRMAQGEGKNPFAEVREKAAPGMKKLDEKAVRQMTDMLEQMNKTNQKGWETMEKMHAQDRKMMEKLGESLQKLAGKAENREAGEPVPAEETAEKTDESIS